MANNDRSNTIWEQLKTPLIILGGFIILIWALEGIDLLIFRGRLDGFGIRPRTISGLWGILWAPFLHGGFRHVMANTGPILVLGTIVMLSRRLRDFFLISLMVILIGGIGTWVFGQRFSVHLGASGLIFGYFGFLVIVTYFERSFRNILIAVIVLLLYSGIIWGVLPQGNGISWQTHLFGFIGGGTAAYFLGQRKDDELAIKIGDEIH
jgi:membrane associated rhomboid family serine protease